MKIRELFEENNFRFELEYTIFYFGSFKAPNKTQMIEEYFRKNIDFRFGTFAKDLFSNQINLRFGHVFSNQVTNEKIEEVKEKIVKPFFENLGFLSNIDIRTVIRISEIPGHKIKADEISLILLGATSLSKIDKLIEPKTKFRILNAEYITSNVLSLLNMDCDVVLSKGQNTNFSKNLGWLKILKSHLDGDSDILACKEELVNGGYKDYAKL